MGCITVGTASMRHPTFSEDEVRPDSAEPLYEEAEALVNEASGRGCDILCLPELFAQHNRSQPVKEIAETTDGPTVSAISRMAREHSTAIVTTVCLKEQGKIHNTCVIFGKDGRLAGTYRKVHLPVGEREFCTEGEAFGVFEVEGVKVGMQICYDLNFPEGCRSLALDGADIVFWPNMWGGLPEEYTEIILRARAMENLVWVVSSAYYLEGEAEFRSPKIYGRSCVVSWAGAILAEVGRRTGVACASIDVGERRYSQSTRENMLCEHRRPSCYRRLVEAGKTEKAS